MAEAIPLGCDASEALEVELHRKLDDSLTLFNGGLPEVGIGLCDCVTVGRILNKVQSQVAVVRE